MIDNCEEIVQKLKKQQSKSIHYILTSRVPRINKEQASNAAIIYFSNQCKNYTTIEHQVTALRNYRSAYQLYLHADALALLNLKIEKLTSLDAVKSSYQNLLLYYFIASTDEDSKETKLQATKILDATTIAEVNAAIPQEQPRRIFYPFI